MDILLMLEDAGIRATPNRQLVLKAVAESSAPMGLIDIEAELDTVDRSSILRVLTLLLEHHLIHTVVDGRGITRYELCHNGHNDELHNDMHAHFYCDKCQRLICLDDIVAPEVKLPVGYTPHSVNFTIHGVCAECNKLPEKV